MSRASRAPEPSPPLPSDAAGHSQERLRHGARPALSPTARLTPTQPRNRFRAKVRRVPTSAPRPKLRFWARGGEGLEKMCTNRYVDVENVWPLDQRERWWAEPKASARSGI